MLRFALALAIAGSVSARASLSPGSESPPLPFRTLAIDFSRVVTGDARGPAEPVSGRIYLVGQSRILASIDSPVHQVLEVEGEHLRIYYPHDGRAFDILIRDSQEFRFFRLFLSTLEADGGLARLGFIPGEVQTRGDSVVTMWTRPEKSDSRLPHAVLTRVRGRLARLEIRDASGRCLSRCECFGTLRAGGYDLPERVVVSTWNKGGWLIETTTYANPEIDQPLPRWVIEFELPADAEIKDLR